MSPDNRERFRLEGYLPRSEFEAKLRMGLGRVAFVAKRFDDARVRYQQVIDDSGQTTSVPEAVYWEAVCRYSARGDHKALGEVAKSLEPYPYSEWSLKSLAWTPKEEPSDRASLR